MAASYHSNNKETQKTATVEDSYFKDKLAQLEEQVKRVIINTMDKRRAQTFDIHFSLMIFYKNVF